MDEPQCVLCEIISGRVPAHSIYEDDDVLAILDLNGAAPGHVFIIPKQHIPILEQVPNHLVGKMFNVANNISSAIFDTLKVQGTNIFMTNGVSAGQKVAHAMVQVIPRAEGDGIQLEWPPKQLDEEEMSTIELKLKEEVGKIGFGSGGGSSTPAVAAEVAAPVSSPDSEIEGEDNYLLKQLERIP
jgi:histidine triad (HIT) family protein|tara:strand:- start:132 stop:686 length:555 start_codon:yes stop_codon:yes gene_type:complete